MEISVWQKKFAGAVEKKFPKCSDEERLLLLLGNVADVGKCLRKYKQGKCSLTDLQYRIVCIFPDLFVLCEDSMVEPDEKLKQILKWFEKQPNRE